MALSGSHGVLADEFEYTDFGKGFYIHPPENRKLAIDWAKRHAKKAKTDWGVLCLMLSQKEYDRIPGEHLYFKSKRDHRYGARPRAVHRARPRLRAHGSGLANSVDGHARSTCVIPPRPAPRGSRRFLPSRCYRRA